MDNNKLVLFEARDGAVTLDVNFKEETVWLTANQMAVLFERDEKNIRKHINNIFKEEELERENNTQKMRVDGVKQPVAFYNLDVIISVGYRVNSKRGIEFRRWANGVLRDYIIKGYAVNTNRINQLNEVIRIMKRVESDLDTKQVLSVIQRYSQALDLLDAYDHQNMTRPKGNEAIYVLTYEECRKMIDSMKFAQTSKNSAISCMAEQNWIFHWERRATFEIADYGKTYGGNIGSVERPLLRGNPLFFF